MLSSTGDSLHVNQHMGRAIPWILALVVGSYLLKCIHIHHSTTKEYSACTGSPSSPRQARRYCFTISLLLVLVSLLPVLKCAVPRKLTSYNFHIHSAFASPHTSCVQLDLQSDHTVRSQPTWGRLHSSVRRWCHPARNVGAWCCTAERHSGQQTCRAYTCKVSSSVCHWSCVRPTARWQQRFKLTELAWRPHT